MPDTRYIKVILPLRLKWLPTYVLTGGQEVSEGDRVRVRLSGKEYSGVVYRISSETDVDGSRLSEVLCVEGGPAVTAEELKLWEFLSGYYLCTLGEVFRMAVPKSTPAPGATPAALSSDRRRKTLPLTEIPRRPSLSDREKAAVTLILDSFQAGKPALLRAGEERNGIYRELARRTLESGRDVLVLRPELKESDGPLRYESGTTPASRRELRRLLREHPGQLIFGTRSSVFLPWRTLGLIIIDDEHSREYKQESAAPRYNARDTAVFLGSLFRADVLLCSSVPSMESYYNCKVGRYSEVSLQSRCSLVPEIIDTAAMKRRRGMKGSFSLALLKRMEDELGNGGSVLLLQPWKDTSDIEIEARTIFPKAGARLNSLPLWKANPATLSKYGLTALLNADFMLSRQDFRADEKACRELAGLKSHCNALLIQTSLADHPVFTLESPMDTILSERKAFGLPPFTREIRISDKTGSRSEFLPKDSDLPRRKAALAESLGPDATIDVDPV